MTMALAEQLVQQLSLPETVVGIEFLDKGYSPDRKYVLKTDTGNAYLLRLSDIVEVEIRRVNYEMVVGLWQAKVRCSRPICFGTYPDASICYMVLSYLEGACAEKALPRLVLAQQYEFGKAAGEELARIHHALSPAQQVDNYTRRREKYAHYLDKFKELGFTFVGQEEAEQYTAAHIELLRNQPTTFRHGDYHPGNLIEKDGALVGVIDFNRCDWGDPIDEFYKLAFWGAPLSREYACGQIRGYFDGNPPAEFWPLYNLHVAMALPTDMVWRHWHQPEQFQAARELVELIAGAHDFENGCAPTWWQG
jgi:aminoglycoside phosphotransferase (APT) family kinase protein